ncbi:MAG: YlmH/Sll1252 family protein [Defluviitaleaceae bacterium]|nr:YlmH/Sll1252 family protein [Defluviitaleaceae bacterium]
MRPNKKNFHIDPALQPLFANVLDRLFLCESRHIPAYTDFFDPAKWTSFEEAIVRQKPNVQVVAFGGIKDCERRMLGFFPFEIESSEKNPLAFPIARLRISYNSKFNKPPRHQDYLGSILGLGFDRGKIGDIFLASGKNSDESYAEVFVFGDISEYICDQLEKVGKVPVKAQIVTEQNNCADVSRSQETEKQLNIASLRLDAIISALFKVSRGQAAALIKSEKVFVNWSPQTDVGKQIKPGDMVTLRGHGRARIGEIVGTTKKDRLRLTVFLS